MILRPGGAQRPAGLGDVDDAVDDVGHLRLGGAVAEADVGVDALLLEEAPGQLGVLARHPHALGQVLDPRRPGESLGTATTMWTGRAVAFE